MNLNRWSRRSMTLWMVLPILVLAFAAASVAQIGISVRIGPPVLPVYAQPICPGPGYMWTPGYWAWNDDEGYYWVPGTWVMAPVGMLWTPGWWGWGGGFYVWHPGYWGPHVGFYGGVNYGYGYGGDGFAGGEWRGRDFYYNRSVTNVSVTNVTNVYNKTVVVNNTTVNNVSYNGGAGGIQARPTPQQERYMHEQHTPALEGQRQQEHLAMQNRENFARVNHGRPAIAATARAGDFSSHSVIPARAAGGQYHAPAMSPREARGPAEAANRPSGGRSNEGFRPFTPPGKNDGANRGGNQNRGNQVTPPSRNNGGGNFRGGNQNRGNEVTPPARNNNGGNFPRENQNRGNQGRGQAYPNAPRPQEQHRSSPPPERHPGPPPREEGHPH